MNDFGGSRGGRLMVLVGRWARRLAMVALALAATSCTPKPAPSPSASTPPVSLRSPSPSPAPTDPRVAAVQDAVAAYRGMWQAYETVAQNPDPQQSDLARYATGDALRTMTNGLQSLKNQGLEGTGSVTHSPRVTEVSPVNSPTQVSISDCMDTSASHIVRASPGPAYSDSPGGRRLCLATVQRQGDGAWRVTGFGVRAVGTC